MHAWEKSRIPHRALVVAAILFMSQADRCFGLNGATYQQLFWSDINDNTIKRLVYPSNTPQTIFSGAGQPTGLAIDAAHGQLYFGDDTASTPGKIYRSNYDGTGLVTVLSEPVQPGGGTQFVDSLALDPAHDWIYFNEGNTRTVRRVHFNGSGEQVVFQGSLNGPFHVALDVPNNYLYFTHIQSTSSQIVRTRLDGSQPQVLFSDTGFYSGLEVDPQHGYIYFSDYYPGNERIRRINLDGGNPITLVAQPDSWPSGTDLDLQGGKLYWARSNSSTTGVFRSNLDGSGLEPLVSLSSAYSPWDTVALVPEPASAGVGLIGLMLAARCRKRR